VHRWEDNIKIELREIGHGCMEQIQMDKDGIQRLAFKCTAMNLWVP
jgi:hypothetical protein